MLELSLILSMQGNGVVNFALSLWTSVTIAYTVHSLVLRVKACCSSSVKRYLQPIPVCRKKPPITHSDGYEKVGMVGLLKITLLMEIPYFSDSSNSSQSSSSSRMRLESLTLFLRLAVAYI